MLDLRGKKVLVTRPKDQAQKTLAKLREQGAEPVLFPLIQTTKPSDNFASLDFALQNLQHYDWIVFTSQNAVKYFFSRPMAPMAEFVRAQIAAVGPETAQLLQDLGFQHILLPEEHSSNGLAKKFQQLNLKNAQMLFPRAKEGRDELLQALQALGAHVSLVEAYQTVLPEDLDKEGFAEVLQDVDVIYFASPSAVKNYFHILQERKLQINPKISFLIIGSTTQSELLKCCPEACWQFFPSGV